MKIKDKIVDLLTDKKRKVPLAMVFFDYQKYESEGEKGSCTVSIHPGLKDDAYLCGMLEDVIDYIRHTYNMKELVEI